jgi:hypothetical protein
MTITPPPTPSPVTLGALEAAGIAFIGAFAGAALVAGTTLVGAAEVGAVAAAVTLGYHAYQSS